MNYIRKILRILLYSLVTKKMLIVIIFLLIVFILGSKIYAMEFSHHNVEYNLPDFTEGSRYIVGKYQQLYYLWCLQSDSAYFESGPYHNNCLVSGGSAKLYNLVNGVWVDQNVTHTNESVSDYDLIIGATTPIYVIASNGQIKFQPNIVGDIPPYIMDDALNLATLNMTNISIDSGNLDLYNDQILFNINMRPRGDTRVTMIYGTILRPSSEFYNSGGVNGAYYEIPVSIFKDLLTEGYEIDYWLEWWEDGEEEPVTTLTTVVYNPQAQTVDDIELLNDNINSNFNKLNNNISNLQQSQNATNQFLKDDNFDNSNLNLPTDNTTDITQDGINNLFTTIYNAFTSGQAPDIVIPIPYTGKSFTIPADYLTNVIENSQFAPIKNIIQLFWWYFISVFIIKDITEKITKMKSGDLENLENSNIKEEML